VIGGGLSGLAVAAQICRLQRDRDKNDVTITLLESRDRLGGVIQTQRVGDWVIDHGADMFATKPPAAIELIESLGASDQLIQPKPNRRGARICRGGNLVPIPEGFVLMRATQAWPMWKTSLLSLRGKLRFFAERFVPARTANEAGASDGTDADDESVASFVRRRMGSETLDRIVAPLSAGIYTADVEKLSMRSTMGPLWAMEKKYKSLAAATLARKRSGEDSVERASTGARYGQFRAFRGGMAELIQLLASSLPKSSIRTGVHVQSIRSDPQRSVWLVADQDGNETEFDQVVVALPPGPAGKLIRSVAPDAADGLSQIQCASTAIVVMVVKRTDVTKDIETFGFVVPLSENRKILAGSFANHKFEGRAPEDYVIVRVFIGGAMQPELLDQDDDALTNIAVEELQQIIGLKGDPEWSTAVRWDNAMPQYHVGHHRIVQKIETSIQQVDGLSVMTNALHGVGIAPVIAQAEKLANTILDESNQDQAVSDEA
jgi:oxygen-dependent protoporphyrinogen oxidase